MRSKYLTHTVALGETLQIIGQIYGVDWTKIAIINGLEYPYIDSNLNSSEFEDTDEVAKIGSRLVIPTRNMHVPNKTNNSAEELERYTFGSDLDLFSDSTNNNGVTNVESLGILNADETTGDVLICNGISNLRQQLIIRLGTPKGSLLMHPEWGCDLLSYIGRTMTMERLIKIKLAVQECVLGDFRVLGISDMRAEFKGAQGMQGANGITYAKGKAVFIDFIVHPIEPYSVFRLAKTFSQ